MVAFALALSAAPLLMRSRSAAVVPTRSAPLAVTPPLQSVPLRSAPAPTTADRRFAELVGQGLEAARDGRLADSVALLKRALELRPRDSETWNSLGVVLVREGETAAGAEAFRQSLRFDPDHLEAHRNLAVSLDRLGWPGEAVAHYRAFLRLSGERHPARDDVQRRLAEGAAPDSGAPPAVAPAGSAPRAEESEPR